jgi:hypothetical protein
VFAMASLRDPDPRMPMGARPIIGEIEQIAASRGLRKARVAYKQNARGEHVIALIFEGFQGFGLPEPPEGRG